MAGRNVTTVVADLVRTLPTDPRLDDVVAAVARSVGTPTRVVDVDGPSWGSLTALVSQAPHENLVLVPAAVPPLYRMHCVLHELGHLLHGDAGAPTPASVASLAAGTNVCQRDVDGRSAAHADDPTQAAGHGLARVSGDDEHFAERFAYEVATVLLGAGSSDERAYG
ncbi:hypothetical protein LQK89_13315 [Curtobacterium sp. C1]|uniref:hypothetical protein n=1 Tax=Curtobacterium sp. C1 TaxID=2898151 RepID=UPI001E4D8176|nr:hypothetical protein [Curtobacterium sp. C1]UFU13482.1 hypothetical protein LQK89_13315 [Curtobacterium sp. C1]